MVLAAGLAAAWVVPAGAAEVNITANNQVAQFREALRAPGTTVRVANGVTLDLSGLKDIEIHQGVQLLGARNAQQDGPLLFTRTRPEVLLAVRGDDVRISGLRIRGPDMGVADNSGNKRAIAANSLVELQIDHNEIFGFQGTAVEIRDGASRIAPVGLPRVRVHDNYIHHNQHIGKLGYGVAVKDGAFVWIERNVFDWNRHAIAADGDPATGYLAYDNLVLQHGGKHRWIPFPGFWVHTHQFDVHGTQHCGAFSIFSDSLYNCGTGGHHVDIRYNAFLYTEDAAVKIRGTPVERPCGAIVYYNTFRHRRIGSAVQWTRRGTCQAANQTGVNSLAGVRACDVNGDGVVDNFLATGRTWWYAHARQKPWTFIRRTPLRPSRCPASQPGI